uniref:Uncharacterized protein n=1 Tax=Ligilactobacillus acidipiscis TaxID=89059 RepID=A0A285PKG0_9LACO|nr:plasmid mobilization relaxosome protein MobC [Ligilactobacillus acidipiscis]SNZ28660.1 hypothetical protein PLAC3_P05 [Ligilactobacillus acidipiscis]SPM00128.1 hypothetical protein PLAC03_P05 [Ligilactobacillus acidipiscis]
MQLNAVAFKGVNYLSNLKSDDERQVKRINFRLDQTEYTKLKLSAETYGLTVSNYAKKLALNSKLRQPYFDHTATKELLLELSRQGTNLNQVARQLNQQPELPQTKQLLAALQAIQEEYRKLWQQLQK